MRIGGHLTRPKRRRHWGESFICLAFPASPMLVRRPSRLRERSLIEAPALRERPRHPCSRASIQPPALPQLRPVSPAWPPRRPARACRARAPGAEPLPAPLSPRGSRAQASTAPLCQALRFAGQPAACAGAAFGSSCGLRMASSEPWLSAVRSTARRICSTTTSI